MFYDLYQNHSFLFIAIIFYLPFIVIWKYLQRRKNIPCGCELTHGIQEAPLTFGLIDYFKALISWLLLFLKVFSVGPGYYYTGQRDENAPLIVTCNNFLTVFLLLRRVGRRNIRLLVVDTNGINVWCSAAEGRFSASEIISKARHVGLLSEGGKTEMVLPKLCLCGVRLSALRKAGIKPVIGPMYAKDLPQYIDERNFRDRVNDHIAFGIQSRSFTAVPTSFQFFYWFTGIYILTFWALDSAIVWSAAALAFMYPLLFPYLPGKRFAVKGMSLGILACIPVIYYLLQSFDIQAIIYWTLFINATSIFIALSFTGNSPVSNYDNVRRETARFLPVVVILYLLIIPVKFILN